MEALLKAMFDYLLAAYPTIFSFDTMITVLDVGAGRELHIRDVNRVLHLPQRLAS